jgi:O-antigen/teichoic acid export membrane protein
VIGFAVAVLLYLQRIADAGFDVGVGVREVAARRGELDRFVPALLTVRAGLAVLVALVTALLALLLLPSPDGAVLALYAGALVAVGLSTTWVHVGLEHAGRVAGARVLGELLALTVLVVTVHGPEHVKRVPLAQVAGDGLAALILLSLLARGGLPLRPRLDMEVALPLLQRGWRMMIASLFGLALYNSDLIFLRWLRDTEAVGYYAAAYTLVAFCLNISIAYGLSLLPVLSGARQDARRRQALFETASAHVITFGLPVVVGGAIVAPAIVALVLGPTYQPTGDALRLLIWSLVPGILANLAVMGLISAERESEVLRAFAWTLGVVMVLDFVLISRFGIAGAAVATIIGESVRLLLVVLPARRAGFTLITFTRWWRPAVATTCMAGVLLLVHPAMLVVAIGLGVVAYAAALTATGGIRFRRKALPVLSV